VSVELCCLIKANVVLLAGLLIGKGWNAGWVPKTLHLAQFFCFSPVAIADIAQHGCWAIDPECVLLALFRVGLFPVNG